MPGAVTRKEGHLRAGRKSANRDRRAREAPWLRRKIVSKVVRWRSDDAWGKLTVSGFTCFLENEC